MSTQESPIRDTPETNSVEVRTGSAVGADSEELDALRAELLRQRVVLEAEMRRQRDYFEERLALVSQELADREADCRNLQAVVTILGKKVDAVAEAQRARPPTPRRAPTPTRDPNAAAAASPSKPVHHDPLRQELSGRTHFARRASPLISATQANNNSSAADASHLHQQQSSATTLARAPSLNSSGHGNPGGAAVGASTPKRRTESPGAAGRRAGHPHATATTLRTAGGRSSRVADGTAASTKVRTRSGSAGARKRTGSASRVKGVRATDKW